jgi:hypothetical protein
VAWAVVGLLLLGGISICRKQPQDRRGKLKEVAGQFGTALLDAATKATAEIDTARAQLNACVVPGPRTRVAASAILRELAISDESLSVQQLADRLDQSIFNYL